MPTNVLSPEQISKLLNLDQPRSNQSGPIIFHDNEMRCAERGCSSPTYIRMDGVPLCMMHIIVRCNKELERLRSIL